MEGMSQALAHRVMSRWTLLTHVANHVMIWETLNMCIGESRESRERREREVGIWLRSWFLPFRHMKKVNSKPERQIALET